MKVCESNEKRNHMMPSKTQSMQSRRRSRESAWREEEHQNRSRKGKEPIAGAHLTVCNRWPASTCQRTCDSISSWWLFFRVAGEYTVDKKLSNESKIAMLEHCSLLTMHMKVHDIWRTYTRSFHARQIFVTVLLYSSAWNFTLRLSRDSLLYFMIPKKLFSKSGFLYTFPLKVQSIAFWPFFECYFKWKLI